jgi:hypothetical protein
MKTIITILKIITILLISSDIQCNYLERKFLTKRLQKTSAFTNGSKVEGEACVKSVWHSECNSKLDCKRTEYVNGKWNYKCFDVKKGEKQWQKKAFEFCKVQYFGTECEDGHECVTIINSGKLGTCYAKEGFKCKKNEDCINKSCVFTNSTDQEKNLYGRCFEKFEEPKYKTLFDLLEYEK